MKNKYNQLFWVLALLTAFCFDQFFWQTPYIGINFIIVTALAILGGLIPLWINKIHLPWKAYLLLIPIVTFAVMTAVHTEPFTTFTNILITLGASILFAITLRNGAWMAFNLREHLVNLVKFLLNSFAGGILFFQGLRQGKKLSKAPAADQPATESGPELDGQKSTSTHRKNPIAPYLRGILIALPVLIILTLLLSSADPIFNNRLLNLFAWFTIENLGEYIFRFFYILVLGYIILSAYYFGMVTSKNLGEKGTGKGQIKPFLGSIEAGIVLGSVNLLFLFFVILQFTYLFGGKANIHLEGFTYAEYARRGFFELLVVVLISLLLFYGLSLFTKRETKTKRWVFSGLGLFLVALVGVILASAYTRLSLYESAYGFTRLRTLTHIFMVWTGVLLVGIAFLEVRQRMDRLALLLIAFIFGFGLTLNLLNIDQFIVKQNVSRALDPQQSDTELALDAGYLFSLSYDSISPLVDLFKDDQLEDSLRDDIGGVLACRLATQQQDQPQRWSSYHFSRDKAISLLQSQSQALEEYRVFEDEGWLRVVVNGKSRSCYGYDYDY